MPHKKEVLYQLILLHITQIRSKQDNNFDKLVEYAQSFFLDLEANGIRINETEIKIPRFQKPIENEKQLLRIQERVFVHYMMHLPHMVEDHNVADRIYSILNHNSLQE